MSSSTHMSTPTYELHRVAMFRRHAEGTMEPLQPNTDEFTFLATAVNIGVKILESPAGHMALAATGRHVCEKWRSRVPPQWRFWGSEAHMEQYVTGFLRKIKADFPLIVIEEASSRDEIAHSRRTPTDAVWAPNPNNYNAKNAGALYFNSERIAAMVDAGKNTTPKLKSRFMDFLFLFSAATAHELTHMFIHFLSGGSNDENSFTPPETTHLNYGRTSEAGIAVGESGRYFENLLFGGSLEFYCDAKDDDNQCGIAYRLDTAVKAKRLKRDSMWNIVRLEDLTFPPATERSEYTTQQRQQLGLKSLGSIRPHSMPRAGPSWSSMRARTEAWYDLSISAADIQKLSTTVGKRRISHIRKSTSVR